MKIWKTFPSEMRLDYILFRIRTMISILSSEHVTNIVLEYMALVEKCVIVCVVEETSK